MKRAIVEVKGSLGLGFVLFFAVLSSLAYGARDDFTSISYLKRYQGFPKKQLLESQRLVYMHFDERLKTSLVQIKSGEAGSSSRFAEIGGTFGFGCTFGVSGGVDLVNH